MPGTYSGSNFIENCGEASLGDADLFAEACTTNVIEGTNSIGTYVWQDANADGAQDEGTAAGITAVQVSLYWDKNGDGALDSGDVLITTQDTSGVNDANYTFPGLPNGDYLVVVDDTDTDLPFGYGPTTATTFAVTGLGTTVTSPYVDADFGFGPILAMTKALSSNNPAYEGEEVTWTIDLENTRPGDGTGQGSACTYIVWASAEDAYNTGSGQKVWTNVPNAFNANELDGQYANSDYASGSANRIAGTGFNDIGPQAGTITRVEALFQVYLDLALTNDFAIVHLYFPASTSNLIASNSFTTAELNTHVGTANAGFLSWNVTFSNSWTWADFPGDLGLVIETHKSQSSDDGILYLDAMGFRVTTDETCGGADDTITMLPLSDEYDSSLFSFVSASPAPDSATTGVGANYNPAGLLSWTNLGPLYAGQTQQVTVVLKA
ncbi:MAG: hypothetical protein GY792_19410, partial [Gammaproteobacteria bacterium]|nr:hypothetical protein [Gammaproteobacteria bacterium]